MKTETRIADIVAHLAARTAATQAAHASHKASQHLTATIDGPSPAIINPSIIAAAQLSRIARDAAAADLAKRPKNRREQAERAVTIAEEITLRAARRMGGSYSGDTTHGVEWHTAHTPAIAYTTTSQGDSYSRSCKYSKTDAHHGVRLDPAGIPALVENEALRNASSTDGLPLISLMEDGRAIWLKSTGKQITEQAGWIIGTAGICYHSTKSREDAQKGFDKKHAEHIRQQALRDEHARQYKASPAYKAERRARLIARLCSSLTATIEDARAIGYCTPGIEQFQRTHAISDTATLPQLIKTGNSSAIALALTIARKAAKTTLV